MIVMNMGSFTVESYAGRRFAELELRLILIEVMPVTAFMIVCALVL